MPTRLLTTLSPAPDGFARMAPAKHEIMSGTVVLLVRDLDEVTAILPGATSRLRGLLLTLDAARDARRLGPFLWHLRLPPDDLPALAGPLTGFAEMIEEASRASDLADSRAIELTRLHADLKATRRDYHDSLHHLGESAERFRALVETSRDWIWETDTAGLYTYSSPRVRDLLGYRPEEVLGHGFLDLMPPEEAERVRPLYEAAARQRKPLVNLENVNLHRDGRLVILETSGVPIVDAQGRWHGYRGIDRDITMRKQAEEERLQLERRILHSQKLESLGVLAGGIAHDFNNLLVAVLGNAELALLDMPETAPGRESVVDIRRAALRASELTNQMLAYSGKGRFRVERVDLGDLVREMGRLLSVSICKRARMQYELQPDLPPIEVDAAQIRQIVMNLVTNASEAIESSEGEGVIVLRTRLVQADRERLEKASAGEDLPAGDYVSLEIADTGCGMTEEVQARLFDPFFTTKFFGRGLGMAAVQGIVRGHRGALEISSRPKAGTCITVLLPAGRRHAAAAADPPLGADRSWQGTGTVLVIDDEENVRDFARRVLARQGFAVLTAADGRQGLALFGEKTDEVAIVLLDLTMPGLDGEQTFLELKRLAPQVPVILASGYNEQEATSRFTGQGLAGFIKKPFTIEELTRVIRGALGS